MTSALRLPNDAASGEEQQETTNQRTNVRGSLILVRDMRDGARQIVNVVLAIAQPVTAWIVFRGTSDFFDAANDPPIVPAPYAFSIWGLIFACSVLYAVYQALPAHRHDRVLREAGAWTAIAFFTTSFWMVLARARFIWPTFIDIVAIFAALVVVFLRTHRPDLTVAERWLVRAPFAIFTGWLSVAVFANLTTALDDSGVTFARTTAWTLAALAGVGAVAIILVRRSSGDILYGATIAWAAVAIAIDNLAQGRVAIAMSSLALLILIVAFMFRARVAVAVQ